MERTSRWLIISIIIVGLGILACIGKVGYDYISKQNKVKQTETATSSDVSEGTGEYGTSTQESYMEDPYFKIKRETGLSGLEEGTVLEVAGYELEMLSMEYIQEYGDWRLPYGNSGSIGQKMDEPCVVFHMKVTASEEFLPYVYKEGISQYPVQNAHLLFFNEDQELIGGYEVYGTGGDGYVDGPAETGPYVVDLNYGETKEFEIAFKDEDHLFRQDKPFYIVLNPSISGVAASGAVEGDIWKGFLRYVEN